MKNLSLARSYLDKVQKRLKILQVLLQKTQSLFQLLAENYNMDSPYYHFWCQTIISVGIHKSFEVGPGWHPAQVTGHARNRIFRAGEIYESLAETGE